MISSMTTVVILLTLIEPLNEVTLTHSEVLPAIETLAAQDSYVGYELCAAAAAN